MNILINAHALLTVFLIIRFMMNNCRCVFIGQLEITETENWKRWATGNHGKRKRERERKTGKGSQVETLSWTVATTAAS